MKTIGIRILVKPDELEEKITKGGIILNAKITDKPNKGSICIIGPDVKWCAVGNKIQYNTNMALEIEVDNEKYVLINENDIQIIFN